MAVVRERPDFSISRIDVPDVGSIFTDFANRQMRQHQIGLDNAMQQAKMEEDKRRYEIDLGFKQRQEGRTIDELNRAQATREAIQAQLNPELYKNTKLTEYENAVKQSLDALSPEERAATEQAHNQMYDRTSTGNWLVNNTIANDKVDPSAILKARSDDLAFKLQDPNSLESKAARKAEMDDYIKKQDYSHGLSIKLHNLKNKYDLDKEKKEADELSRLFDVSTTEKIVTGTNADAIGSINKANKAIGDKQEAYSDAFSEAYSKNPNAKFEDLDSAARKAVGIRNFHTPLDKLIPLAPVPEYEEQTKVVNKSVEKYTKDLMDKAREEGTLNSNTLKFIDLRSKGYEEGLKNKAEKEKENMTLEGFKNVIKDLKGDPNLVNNKEDAKEYINALKEKVKAGSKKKDSPTLLGVGPLSLDAMNITGLDASDRKLLDSKIASKYISDKDLAAVINTANQNHTWTPTMSSTQRKAIEDLLESYPDRK